MKAEESRLESLWKAKEDAVRLHRDAEEDVMIWAEAIDNTNRQIAAIHKDRIKSGSAHTRVITALVIITILFFVTVLAGCNTVNGIGQDLQAVSKPYIQEK